MSRNNLFRDAILLATGAKLLRKVGIQPGSFWGGTTLGFFGGNMAGVYGFDARETLTTLHEADSGNIKLDKADEMAESIRNRVKENLRTAADNL